VLNSAALAEEVIFDVENFSNRGVVGMRDAPPNQFRPGSMDPPEHRAYRMMAMADFRVDPALQVKVASGRVSTVPSLPLVW
jgi:hypothetical protein